MGLSRELLEVLYSGLGNFASSTLESGAAETRRCLVWWRKIAIVTAAGAQRWLVGAAAE